MYSTKIFSDVLGGKSSEFSVLLNLVNTRGTTFLVQLLPLSHDQDYSDNNNLSL